MEWGQTLFHERLKASLLRGSIRQASRATTTLFSLRLTDISQEESLYVWHLEYDRHILKFNYCPLTDTYFQCKFKKRTFCHQLILQDAELPRFTLISSECDSSDWQPDDLCLRGFSFASFSLFSALVSETSSIFDFSEGWTIQSQWFSDSTSEKQQMQPKWNVGCHSSKPTQRERQNQLIYKIATWANCFDESWSVESGSKRQVDLRVKEITNMNKQETSHKHSQ